MTTIAKTIAAITLITMMAAPAFAQGVSRGPALDPGCAFMKSLYEYIDPTAGC